MSRYVVTLFLTVTGPAADRTAHFEYVTDCYAKLEEVHDNLLDSAWSLSDEGAYADVEVEITVEASDESHAYDVARASARTAIHDADGFTPGWEDEQTGVGRIQYRIAREEAVPVR